MNVPKYGKRIYFYRKNSSPFLSGDLFADAADVQVYSPRLRRLQPSKKLVSGAKVVFCPSHEYERLLDDYNGSLNARVLILGNSDRDFEFFDESSLPSSVNQVFVQNLYTPGPRSRLLPIGIENLRLGTNGLKNLFKDEYIFIEKLNKVLIGPFSMTHPDRNFYTDSNLEICKSSTVLRGRLTPQSFAKIASTHKFIASPRGNGLDTHRFWEALYRGSYPLVTRNGWSSQLKNLQIPLIEIDSWLQDFSGCTHESLPNFDPRNLKSLWWPFWKDQIRKSCY